jgi:hypothetical protein
MPEYGERASHEGARFHNKLCQHQTWQIIASKFACQTIDPARLPDTRAVERLRARTRWLG